jgi:hypothetical protein
MAVKHPCPKCARLTGILFLDELPEAFDGIVPLLRCPLKILPCLEQGVGSNDKPTFSSDPFARDDSGLFQNSQVLAHTLPTEASALRKLDDRPGVAVA